MNNKEIECRLFICLNDPHMLHQLNKFSYDNNDFSIVGSYAGDFKDVFEFKNANIIILNINDFDSQALRYLKYIKNELKIKIIGIVSRKYLMDFNNINDLNLMVDRYIIGSYQVNQVVSCINDFKKDFILKNKNIFNNIITNALLGFGIPVHFSGFKYFKTAIILLNSINYNSTYKVMDLYKDIAMLNNTTSSRVEKALRNALKSANIKAEGDKIKCHSFILTLNERVLREKEKYYD